ncbi:hypothetical protein ABK040_002614 [Willaertia magna]
MVIKKTLPSLEEIISFSYNETINFLEEALEVSVMKYIPQFQSERSDEFWKPLVGYNLCFALAKFSEDVGSHGGEAATNNMIKYFRKKVLSESVADEISSFLIAKYYKAQTKQKSGVTTIHTFKEMLIKSGINKPNARVLNRIVDVFWFRLMNITTEKGAIKLYEFVKSLPATTTRAFLEQNYGIKLNGIFDPQFPNIISGAENGQPVLVKILVGSTKEKEMEVNAIQTLKLERPPQGIAPIKVCQIQREGVNYCLLMPHYPRSLSHMYKLLSEKELLQGGKIIKEALTFIHNKGFVHMDVKPSNIFVSTEGQWFLGDFGSCVEIGQKIMSCTECYLPERVIGTPALSKYDYFMLSIGLLSTKRDIKEMLSKNNFNEDVMIIDRYKTEEIISSLTYEPLKDFIKDLIKDYLNN